MLSTATPAGPLPGVSGSTSCCAPVDALIFTMRALAESLTNSDAPAESMAISSGSLKGEAPVVALLLKKAVCVPVVSNLLMPPLTVLGQHRGGAHREQQHW